MIFDPKDGNTMNRKTATCRLSNSGSKSRQVHKMHITEKPLSKFIIRFGIIRFGNYFLTT